MEEADKSTASPIHDGRARFKSKAATCVILITVCFERAAYYSLLGDLATFLNTELQWPPAQTAVCVLVFTGMSWISCFIGGVLGDTDLRRYDTIALGLLLYVFGFISLPLLANFKQIATGISGRSTYVVVWLSITLFLVSLGEGFFKSNMSPFGADQVEQKFLHGFFSVFYSFINIGSIIGYGPIIYLEEQSFLQGYFTAVTCIAAAAVIFMVPRNCLYQCTSDPNANGAKRVWKIALEAWGKTGKRASRRRAHTELESLVPINHWLDRASAHYGGSFTDMEVNEVKRLCEILVPFGFLVVYYILYYQISGTFLLQGIHMNTRILGFRIPAAWLSLMNCIFVILFIPIVDKLLYPSLQYCGFSVSHLQRISIGMLLGSVALVCAALVETRRLEVKKYVSNTISGNYVNATDLAVWYQIPQYAVCGISEVLVSLTGLEYAYTQAPKSMRSISTGLFFVSNGLGSFIASILLEIADAVGLNILADGKMKDSPMEGRLHYFFYMLAILNAVVWFFFTLYICRTSGRKRTKWRQGWADVNRFIKQSKGRKTLRYGTMDRQISV